MNSESTTLKGAYIAYKLFIYSCLFTYIPYVAAAELGRLFTTLEARLDLQTLRDAKPESEVTAETDVRHAAKPTTNSITLNGIVYRASGNSTAWLNGQDYYQDNIVAEDFAFNSDDISHKAVSVTIPKTGAKLTLKVGQTYQQSDEQLLETNDTATAHTSTMHIERVVPISDN